MVLVIVQPDESQRMEVYFLESLVSLRGEPGLLTDTAQPRAVQLGGRGSRSQSLPSEETSISHLSQRSELDLASHLVIPRISWDSNPLRALISAMVFFFSSSCFLSFSAARSLEASAAAARLTASSSDLAWDARSRAELC